MSGPDVTRPRTAMVIASNRIDSLKTWCERWYIKAYGLPWDALIVVEDGPTLTPGIHPCWGRPFSYTHYAWDSISADLGRFNETSFISRRDSAIKSYGFYKAAVDVKADIIMTLDDDCYPVQESVAYFAAGHVAALGTHDRWVTTVPGLDVRGLPYRNRGTLDGMINMGFWAGVPDLDSVHQLVGPSVVDFSPPPQCLATRIANPNRYFPMCGMNLAFRREAAPLMYFPKMGEGSPYARFDDIWCGVIAQRICRHLGWSITAGPPVIWHSRQSDAMVNLIKEAPGIAANEHFWQIVEAVDFAGASTALGCMRQVAAAFGRFNASTVGGPEFATYINDLCYWVGQWCDLFKAKGWT